VIDAAAVASGPDWVTDDADARSSSAGVRLARHRVSFVLPAYNEEANIVRAIENTVAAATRHCAAYELIVVDDGSSDRTAQLVDRQVHGDACIRLIRHERNRGYGEALKTGFESAELDYVFFTDADNQFDLNELPLVLAWADDADVVAGYRKQRKDPTLRRINAWTWNRLVRMLFYVPVRDIDCAFKLFRRSALTGITIESRGALINTEIMVKLSRAGCHVVEVGVTHLPRTAGEASGANLRVIARAFREVARMYRLLNEFASPSAPCPRASPSRGLDAAVPLVSNADVSAATLRNTS
jgi:glycosyltransferase involved in cell wall biosynthesis